MKQENVQRLIAVSTGTAADPGDAFDWKIRLPALLIKYMMRSTYGDIQGVAQTIRAADLEWTMVRVGFLKSRPLSRGLNVGLYGHTRHFWTVSREDAAAFMFDQISKGELVHQAPGISSRKV
jgi:hypothetical protein